MLSSSSFQLEIFKIIVEEWTTMNRSFIRRFYLFLCHVDPILNEAIVEYSELWEISLGVMFNGNFFSIFFWDVSFG